MLPLILSCHLEQWINLFSIWKLVVIIFFPFNLIGHNLWIVVHWWIRRDIWYKQINVTDLNHLYICPLTVKIKIYFQWLHNNTLTEESWAPKNWCFWTVVLEKTLESPLDCKEIQPVHSEGDQPWDIFGRNDAKAETPVLWPPHAKSWLIGKDSAAGRDWGQEEKGTTEDEMAGWHHWLDGRESEWTSGVGDGQGGLVCWDSWGHKESDTTERLNWTEYLIWELILVPSVDIYVL